MDNIGKYVELSSIMLRFSDSTYLMNTFQKIKWMWKSHKSKKVKLYLIIHLKITFTKKKKKNKTPTFIEIRHRGHLFSDLNITK